MAGRPLVSVVVPAHNAARFLRPTLESALAQTYAELEVVVVDDGSTDATAAIAEAYAAADPRVRVVRQENAGVAAARNRGIREARGEFVAPLDADDLWRPAKIERQAEALRRAGPAAGLAYAWWYAVDDRDRFLYGAGRERAEGRVFERLIRRNFVGCASVPLIRRECLEAVGVYRPELKDRGGQGCEDWDLSLRIAERFEFRVVPERLVGYRQFPGSMSGSHRVMLRSYELMIGDLRRRRPDVADAHFRNSRGRFMAHVAKLRLSAGDYRGALVGAAEALLSAPSVAVSADTLHAAVFRLPRILGLRRPAAAKPDP